jgi:hypothetical protein
LVQRAPYSRRDTNVSICPVWEAAARIANRQDRLIIVQLPPGGGKRLAPLPKLVLATDQAIQIVDPSGCPYALLSRARTFRLRRSDALASLRTLRSSSE